MRARRSGSNPEPVDPQESVANTMGTDAPGDLLVEDPPSSDTVTVLAAVNLLPRSYARRAAVRRAKVFAIGAIVVALMVASVAWMVAWQKETAAQEGLDAATAERALLQAEAVKYSDVPRVFAAVADAQAQLELAMSNEVRWSFFLNDLALTMPKGVSLDTLSVNSPLPGAVVENPAPTSAAAEPISGSDAPAIGTMTVSAKAMSYNTVANWLDSLAKLPTLAYPYVDSLSAATEEGTEIATFTSDASITDDALSQRYTTPEVSP